jgi:hypothetical protein
VKDTDEADPPELATAVEEIRAYLVQVRGGAAFLSPGDGVLARAWLKGGVTVGTILRAVDHAAARRRARRTRVPLSLRGCKRDLGKTAPAVMPHESAPEPVTDALAAETAARIAAVDLEDPELTARARCALAREFHDRTWERLRPEHPRLLAEAAEELSALKEIFNEAEMAAACEEHARDRLRRRYPAFTATAIWEACLGVE